MPFYYDFNKPHDNAILRFVRKIYRPLHFEKGYSFPLWVIFGGAFFAFGLSRCEYFDINGTFREAKIVNGDWYYWKSGYQYVGIVMHLAGTIPACLLVPWQFLPVVRHKALWLHRLNGYLSVIVMLIGIAGAFMIAQNSTGGQMITQLQTYVIGIWVIVSLAMAYINIKRLQIDQHRNWMLRAWFVAAYIITLRIIQLAAFDVVSKIGPYYLPTKCQVIDFTTEYYARRPLAATLYPECARDPTGMALVKVDYYGDQVEQIGATINATFAITSYISLILHAVGVEIYIRLTPAEAERLKQVSYERQLARGWRKPGSSSGLTAEVLGDAPEWIPNAMKKERPEMGLMDGSDSDMVKGETQSENMV